MLKAHAPARQHRHFEIGSAISSPGHGFGLAHKA
jgi:hypothetical protein